MPTNIVFNKKSANNHKVFLFNNSISFDTLDLEPSLIASVELHLANKKTFFGIINKKKFWYFCKIENKNSENANNECARKEAVTACAAINADKIDTIEIVNHSAFANAELAFAEGLALSNYKFLKYYKNANEKANTLASIIITGDEANKETINTLDILCKAVCHSRDLVNTPVMDLNSVDLAKAITAAGKSYGFKTEVWDKKKIKENNFGGLMAVNMGSPVPPTFTIMEHKPAKALNKKPIVLVGKGIVYDTGGLSIKPTPDSMDHMKCDMGGAAAVLGAFIAVVQTKIPLHIIGLIPSTDNRINGLEYTPGDVIKMHNGLYVEVLNTDAEGRMILADALSYAQKYNPELVIDIATLTGAASRAIGPWGHAVMGNAAESVMKEFIDASYQVFERAVELPFWDEYAEKMKSSIADLKNVGGADGGAMTAGKFLEFFTNYPYIHNDIAGTAFSSTDFNYRGKGGTGYGVRLLFKFLQNRAAKK